MNVPKPIWVVMGFTEMQLLLLLASWDNKIFDIEFTREEMKELNKKYPGWGSVLGLFRSRKPAAQAVVSNCCDIHECSYQYMVLFPVLPGVYPSADPADEEWFRYNELYDVYEPIASFEHPHLVLTP
jgi:hypothetical protein